MKRTSTATNIDTITSAKMLRRGFFHGAVAVSNVDARCFEIRKAFTRVAAR